MAASRGLAEKQISIFNAHDAEGWTNSYAEDATVSDPGYPEPLRGREAIRKDIDAFFTAFPDMQFTVTDVITDGDKFVVEGTGTGTHQGPLQGPQGEIPPTNKRITTQFVAIGRVDGSDLIVEERRYYDQASLFEQLGLTG